jgi:hypothetical protein
VGRLPDGFFRFYFETSYRFITTALCRRCLAFSAIHCSARLALAVAKRDFPKVAKTEAPPVKRRRLFASRGNQELQLEVGMPAGRFVFGELLAQKMPGFVLALNEVFLSLARPKTVRVPAYA